MAVNNQHNVTGADAPADLFAAITPDDNNDLATNTRAIYVGGAGNISALAACDGVGTPVVFTAVPVGTVLPICARRIRSTGTTATLLIALY